MLLQRNGAGWMEGEKVKVDEAVSYELAVVACHSVCLPLPFPVLQICILRGFGN